MGNAANKFALVYKNFHESPILIQEFEGIPKRINFEDVDGDKNIDFIYSDYYIRMIRYGKGDGTFKEPVEL